jgi:tetratricopeptide (TPR) repeat protein
MQVDWELGRFDKAVAKYVALAEHDPSNIVRLNIDRFEELMAERGASKEEIFQYYRRLSQFNPRDDRVLYQIAEYLKDKKRYSEALEFYNRVLEINPEMKEAFGGMGSCYYNLGQPEKALEYFRKGKEAGAFVPDVLIEKLERELPVAAIPSKKDPSGDDAVR